MLRLAAPVLVAVTMALPVSHEDSEPEKKSSAPTLRRRAGVGFVVLAAPAADAIT